MIIELEQVVKVFNRGEPNEVTALYDVSMAVAAGEMVCITGPSGSGKTTLLSIIGCVSAPTSGRAVINGKKIVRLPDHFLTLYRRELIGFIFQQPNFLGHLTLLENVTLPLLPLGVAPKTRIKRGDVLLQKLRIDHRRDFPLHQLSGGELQRATIARALINEPPIIIADEPTAHLDQALALEVMAILAFLKSEGKTVVLASHDDTARTHPAIDRRFTVIAGRIAEEG